MITIKVANKIFKNKFINFKIIIIAGVILALVSAHQVYASTTAISINKPTVSANVGNTFSLTATTSASGSSDPIVWSSSAPCVTISGTATGISCNFLAASTGTATITAASGQYSDSCVVTVTALPFKITSNTGSGTITTGNSLTLTAPKAINSWTSSKTAVASVSYTAGTATCLINGLSIGTSLILAVASDGTQSAFSVTVTAVEPSPTGISAISGPTSVNNHGGHINLTATVLPSGANQALDWFSSDTSLATVTNGVVVGNSGSNTGNVTISAKSALDATKLSSVVITVIQGVAVTGITISNTSIATTVGAFTTLSATLSPANASNKTLKWSSSDKTIAVVQSNGVVKGIANGVCTVTVSSADNAAVKATCAVSVGTQYTYTRLGGATRFETAVSIAKQGWSTANTVYLTSANNFPDALSGTALACADNSPLLLSNYASTPKVILDEIAVLGAKNIVILGGSGVISNANMASLQKLGYTVTRIYGDDRYKTSLNIAGKVIAKNSAKTAIISSGAGYADALSMSAVAGTLGYPIILTSYAALPAETLTFLSSNGINSVYIAGGTFAVSVNIENQLKLLGISVVRISGANRYATSAAIASYFTSNFSANVSLTAGTNYPDGLTGGVLSGKIKMPLLLIDPQGKNVEAISYINSLSAYHGYVYGGTGVLSDAFVSKIIK